MKNSILFSGITYDPYLEYDENLEGTNNNVYDIITKQILNIIESQENIKWVNGWDTSKSIKEYKDLLPIPLNFLTNKYYHGINAFLLSHYVYDIEDGVKLIKPITDNRFYWMTFKQIEENGGKLKKGSLSMQAVFFSYRYYYNNKPISEDKYRSLTFEFNCDLRDIANHKECAKLYKAPFLKYYNVFNERDITGIDFDKRRELVKEKYKTFQSKREKIEACELIIDNMPDAPAIIERKLKKGESPHYKPSLDRITVPLREQFNSLSEFYGTLFHELIHSTGHKKRNARQEIIEPHVFGSPEYAKEELVAEMGAAFLNAESGILLETLKNNSAYIKGWRSMVSELLKKDNKAIFIAAGQARKAVDYILDKDENGIPAFYKQLEVLVLNGIDMKKTTEKLTKTPDWLYAIRRFLQLANRPVKQQKLRDLILFIQSKFAASKKKKPTPYIELIRRIQNYTVDAVNDNVSKEKIRVKVPAMFISLLKQASASVVVSRKAEKEKLKGKALSGTEKKKPKKK